MVKRKLITGVMVLAGLFLSLILVKDVRAAASCSCNQAYFAENQDAVHDLRINGKDNPEAISQNNCPDTAVYNSTNQTVNVSPICIESDTTEGSWGCHCFDDYYALDIQSGGFTYTDKTTGSSTTTTDAASCASGGNCCVCGLDGSLNYVKLKDYCGSDTQAQCSSSRDTNSYSNNCSCITQPIQVTYSGTNPFCMGDKEINTALGCIPITMSGFVAWLLPILFGIAGGISFLLMVYGFILMATSSGDEKKLQGAKETITSAITGLLLSIFAIFIFRLIAINILKIPGIN